MYHEVKLIFITVDNTRSPIDSYFYYLIEKFEEI